MLAGRLAAARLMDAYGRLLTAHQQQLLRLYYLDDLSLGEIAERARVSRQAVFDGLRRAVREMERMDRSLGLIRLRHQAEQRDGRLHARLRALERAVARLDGHATGSGLRRVAAAVAALRRALG